MKLRHIAACSLIALSIAITPYRIAAMESYRGCAVYGGEYLIIPLGFIITVYMLDAAKLVDKFKKTRKTRYTEGGLKNVKKTHEGRARAQIVGGRGRSAQGNSRA